MGVSVKTSQLQWCIFEESVYYPFQNHSFPNNPLPSLQSASHASTNSSSNFPILQNSTFPRNCSAFVAPSITPSPSPSTPCHIIHLKLTSVALTPFSSHLFTNFLIASCSGSLSNVSL